MQHLDVIWFYFLNSLPERIAGQNVHTLLLLNRLTVFFGEYLLYVILAAIVVMYALSYRATWKMFGISLLGALIARFGLKEIIIVFYHRARPYLVLPHVHKLIATTVADNYQSFPSGHAIFCFALAAGLYAYNKKIGSWYYAAAFIISIARVVAGVHFPSDIIGGAILGIIVGWGTVRAARSLGVPSAY